MKTRHSIRTPAVATTLALASTAEAPIVQGGRLRPAHVPPSTHYSAAALRVMSFHYQALVNYYRVHGATGSGPGTLGPSAPAKALRPDDRSGGVWG
jgi:hypothetical protein